MGYVVLRKREVVDIVARVAKREPKVLPNELPNVLPKGASKVFRDERVYFRPTLCANCQRYIESAPGVKDAECKPCKREREKEKITQPAVEGTKTNNKAKAHMENERLLDEPTQQSNKLEGTTHPSTYDEDSKMEESQSRTTETLSNIIKAEPPRRVCRYEGCVESNQNINTKEKFYLEIHCWDKCNVMLHRSCFNDIKGGVPVKSFLENEAACVTPDCPGTIIVIRTNDLEGKIITSNYSETLIAEEQRTRKKSVKSFSNAGHSEGGTVKGFQAKGKEVSHRDTCAESKKDTNQGKVNENTKPEQQQAPTEPANTLSATTELATIEPATIEPNTTIPIEEILQLDESQLVKLERRDQEGTLLTAKNLKKKKRKSDGKLQFYPDSHHGLTTAHRAASDSQSSAVAVFPTSDFNIDTGSELSPSDLITGREAAWMSNPETDIPESWMSLVSETDIGALQSLPYSAIEERATWASISHNEGGAVCTPFTTKTEDGASSSDCFTDTRAASSSSSSSAVPSLTFKDIIPMACSEDEETGYKLIESLVRTRGGEASMCSVVNQMQHWDEHIKCAMGYPDIKRVLQKDQKKRFRFMMGENTSIIVDMGGHGAADGDITNADLEDSTIQETKSDNHNLKDCATSESNYAQTESKDCNIPENSNTNVSFKDCTISATHKSKDGTIHKPTMKVNDGSADKNSMKPEVRSDDNAKLNEISKESNLDCRPKIRSYSAEKCSAPGMDSSAVIENPSLANVLLIKLSEMEENMDNMIKSIVSQSEELREQNHQIAQLKRQLSDQSAELKRQNHKITQLERQLDEKIKGQTEDTANAAEKNI